MTPILLAPAGSFASLNAAIKAKADAVYFGTNLFNMRARAKNFELNQIPKVVSICKDHNVETHLTLNVQVYSNELDSAKRVIELAKEAGVDSLIAWDPAILHMASEIKLPVHISTQASVANLESALFYEKQGAKAIVLARELTLGQISQIKNALIERGSKLKIEVFGHGAMCVAVSGRCFLSHHAFGKSGNRGECLQPCRRSYRIKDDYNDVEFRVESNTLMSPKDLCTIPVLPKIVNSGIDILKIEGRNRSPDYVYEVVSTYHNALRAIENNEYSEKLIDESMDRLNRVYNKGFHPGFYLGTPSGEDFSSIENSNSPVKKIYVGVIGKIFKRLKVFDLLIHSEHLNVGDNILIIGKNTGVLKSEIASIHNDNHESVQSVKKGELVGIQLKSGELPRSGDKLFIFRES